MSNRIFTIIASLALMSIMIAPVTAASYQFVPSDNDLWDLDHGYYYSWGIQWRIPAGERITQAILFIDNINDWTNESNDHLYMHLLDNPQLGAKRWSDGEGGGDKWASHPFIADYSDTNNYDVDLTYKFGDLNLVPVLESYIANNGVFGIGFDPDCHYYNCGIKLTIKTELIPPPPPVVPEPAGLVAMASGLVSLGGVALRKRSA